MRGFLYDKPILLQDKGLTVCAFHNRRIRLMCTNANVVKCAIFAICTGTVKLACVYTAADRFVHLLHTHEPPLTFSYTALRSQAFIGLVRLLCAELKKIFTKIIGSFWKNHCHSLMSAKTAPLLRFLIPVRSLSA
jgi:hypothetical protein